MTNRRSFLKLGVAAAALPLAGFSVRNPDLQILIDSRYPASRRFAERLGRHGAVSLAGADELAQLWYAELRSQLRQTPRTLAGLTGGDTLFCLEMLARELRLRPSFLSQAPATGADSAWTMRVVDSITNGFSQASEQMNKKIIGQRHYLDDRKALFAWVITPLSPA